ncbi:MAG: DUF2878 domain-containing protein [Dokdonella sp.]
MKNLINFVAFQAVWFAAVVGASYGLWWLGPIAATVFAIAHLVSPMRIRGDGLLIVVALLLGVVIDSAYAFSGALTYAAPFPSAQLAPLWILALWVGFALTLNHSLAYLAHRPVVATIAGAVVGPISYWSAGRAFDAVTLGDPLWRTVLALSVGWAFAMLVLSLVARRSLRTSTTPETQSTEKNS